MLDRNSIKVVFKSQNKEMKLGLRKDANSSTFKVLFLPYNKELIVDEGENVIRAAMEAGIDIKNTCAGEGICGKCRVIIESGTVNGGISGKLTSQDLKNGYRLACMAFVCSDLVIRIPEDSKFYSSIEHTQEAANLAACNNKVNLNGLKEKGFFHPPVEKVYVELPEPTSTDNIPDAVRLLNYLKIKDNMSFKIDFPVIQKLPDILRNSHFKITATLEQPVNPDGKTRIIDVQPGNTSEKNYALVFDIGTTTIYGELVNLVTGDSLERIVDLNTQINYGEDIISRIIFSEKPGGLEKLNELVVGVINSLIKKLAFKSEIDLNDISSIIIAGNTTMTQLFLKISPKSIRRSPYVPATTFYPSIKAASLGIELSDHVTTLFYPQISSYVGGDIVAGIIGSGIYKTEKLCLYMDIGTNAEIVVGNRDWLACAACSAGPAFEGGGISFGMVAMEGAIEDFSINKNTFEPLSVTIGRVKPKGICGSGLINMVAVLFENGIINSKGKFNRNIETSRLRENDGLWEYVVAWARETQIDKDIVLSESDIDNLIRAKGAIYSGFMTLLEEVGLTVNSIEMITIAGGFGNFIDLEKAMTIGLLPETDHGKVTFIGNGSLKGAKMAALSNTIRRDVVEVTKKMTSFELSETKSYMNNYIASLFLPHTDMNLFPGLTARMGEQKQVST